MAVVLTYAGGSGGEPTHRRPLGRPAPTEVQNGKEYSYRGDIINGISSEEARTPDPQRADSLPAVGGDAQCCAPSQGGYANSIMHAESGFAGRPRRSH
jgi:3-deoxy-D-arabino-heptulosonate 7-phosphate (DAHP) synthase class II